MADLSQTSWSETDASNNQASPLGAPEGMFPSGVNDTMRAMMGATKRFWDRVNGTIVATNVGNVYTYTPTVAAPSLVAGEIYTFRCPAANTGAATLNVGVGGAQPLRKHGPSGIVPLDSSDLAVGAYVMALWDSISSQFVILNTPVAGQLATELASLSNVIQTDLHSVSSVIKTDISSVSAAIQTAWKAGDRSTSIVIKADIGSVSSVITLAFVANDASISAVIKADIASVSAAIKADITSVSAVIKADISSVSSVITTAYDAAIRSTSAAITANTVSIITTPTYYGINSASLAATDTTITGIDDWANHIVITLRSATQTGAGSIKLYAGCAAGAQTTGYEGAASTVLPGGLSFIFGSLATVAVTTAANQNMTGVSHWHRINGNVWAFQGHVACANFTSLATVHAGLVSLSATLDRIIISASSSSLSAGIVYVTWEP